jgi:hypothetical protein
MKVWFTAQLNESEKNRAKAAGATHVITNNIRCEAPFPFEIIDANEYRVEGSHCAFDANTELVEKEVNRIWPQAFLHRGVSLLNAALKAVFWSNVKTGYLKVAEQHLPHQAVRLNSVSLHPGSRIKTAVKFASLWLKKFFRDSYRLPDLDIPTGARIAFLVEDMFEYELIRRLAEEFNQKEVVLVLPPFHRFSNHEIEDLRKQKYQVIHCRVGSWIHLPFVNPLRFSSDGAWFLQQYLNNVGRISGTLQWGKALINSPLKVLVVIAQENTPHGHILSELAAAEGKAVVNVMNGIKFGEANDRNCAFQCWMMWDDKMKEMLVNSAGLKPEMLYVGGNLTQDNIRNHQFTGKVPITDEELNTHKIVSIISTRDLRKDKVQALTTLYQWANGKDKVILLYRPHPAEKPDVFFLPDADCKVDLRMVQVESAEARSSLLDQLLSSHLIINFGSTVSIEAFWMKSKCISFEMKEKTWLYCADDEILIHVNNTQDLVKHLNQIQVGGLPRQAPVWDVPYSSTLHAEYIREKFLV